MSRWYELLADMLVPGRSTLGEVRAMDGTEPRLAAGITCSSDGPLSTSLHRGRGRLLDFNVSAFGIPIASPSLARAVEHAAGGDAQCLPVTVEGVRDMIVLNSERTIECIDESRSEFIKWTEHDHRADLVV